jgi:hypothetical protein
MEIRIGKQGRACSATNRQFEHGEQVISLVRYENQALMREDFASEAYDQARSTGALAVWSSPFIDPKVVDQEPPERFSPLRQLFYNSVESTDRCDLAKAFLAAQLLRRQKVFRLLKESDDTDGEARLTLYTDRIGNRLIEVRDPNLTYAELEAGRVALMRELAELENPQQELIEVSDGEQQQN